MKKISLFFLIILLVFLLSVPVFAAEQYTFLIPALPSDFSGDFSLFIVDSIPSVGNYRFEFKHNLYGFDIFCSGTCSVYDYGNYSVIPFYINDGIFTLNFSLMFVYGPDGLAEFGVDKPIVLPMNNDTGDIDVLVLGSDLKLNKMESPGFIDSVNSGLSSVMSWIQSFTSSFLTGELSPLLTVFVLAICVAALFFGIRSIYKICWGC